MAYFKSKLRQFDVLCKKKESFAITSGLILTNLCLMQGVQETIDKNRWYAQISDCIVKGDIENITDIEKDAFIKMHKTFVNQLKPHMNGT